jgi:hypothetical protein
MAEETSEQQSLIEQPKAFSVKPPPELAGLKTQIGGGMPGVTEDYSKAAKMKSSREVLPEQARVLQKEAELDRQIGMAQQAKEQYQAEAKYDIARQEREAAQGIEKNLDATRAKFPYPEFHPTKDNIESLSTLFGLIGVVGMAMGGAGKNSATMALNSMGGMMKGWQQGRADLWKKEKDEFDKNLQKVKSILEDAYKDADRAMKTLAYNRQEAEALATQSAAKLGGQVGQQILAKQGIQSYKALLDNTFKDLNAVEKMAFEKSKFAAEQKQRDRQFELQERRIKLQEKAQQLKEEKQAQGGGELPKDAKTKEEYRARYEIIKNVEDIQSLLEDPKYSKLITPATQFTPQLINNLRDNYPELSQKLARIQAIEFQIGGKALTKTEQEILSPIYGWRGLTADALKSRLAGVREQLQETNALTEDFYPGLKKIHERFDQTYERLGKVPQVSSEAGGSTDVAAKATTAFGAYEPTKYDYRINPDTGNIQRKPKE